MLAKFADMLYMLRSRNGLTQRDLGALVGMSGSTISMYERGEREPSKEALESIADHFNVPIDYLIGRENSNADPQKEGLINDIISRLEKMPEEQLREALSYLDYLISRSEKP